MSWSFAAHITSKGGAATSHAASAPTEKITAVLSQIATQTVALLTRAGYVTAEEECAASDND